MMGTHIYIFIYVYRYVACCRLPIAFCLLPIAYCLSPIVNCFRSLRFQVPHKWRNPLTKMCILTVEPF